MFCTKCGNQLPDNAKFCPKCGNPCKKPEFTEKKPEFTEQVHDKVESTFQASEEELGNAIQEVQGQFRGNNGNPEPSGRNVRLQDNRSLVMYIILSIITCGLYSYYFIYKMAHDVNIACEGDGEVTSGMVAFIVLSFITCGIYSYYWCYKLGNRLCVNAARYGMTFPENGTTVLMWDLFGLLLCGIGPFIGMHILIKNSNLICTAYNKQHAY